MQKLQHPIATFVVGVCCLIGLGVAILVGTGNGDLSSALTCSPATPREFRPPGARFTASFPGPVSLNVPTRVVDSPPNYELCGGGSRIQARAMPVRYSSGAIKAEGSGKAYVNTGRKLTPFHRSKTDPPSRVTDRAA
jgi:hypothetical protein